MLAQYIHVMSQEEYRSAPAPSDTLLSATIDVPIAILGLLLAKKPPNNLNILSQIKQCTSTEILKVAKKDGDDIPTDVERFEVTGHMQEKIDLAIHTLQRIINGINIGIAMRELKQTAVAKGYYKSPVEEKVFPKRRDSKPVKGKREKKVSEEKEK